MKNNNLSALNNILFEQIERVNEDDLSKEELDEAIKRAKVINNLSQTIVQNANVQLKAFMEFGGDATDDVLKIIGIEDHHK